VYVVIPPKNRDGGSTPEVKRRRAKLIGVVGVVVFIIAAVNGTFGHHRRSFDLAPIILFLAMIYVVWNLIRPSRNSRRLEETGTPAVARIVEVHDTGANVWDKSIMFLQLEVLQPGQAGREVRTRALVPHSERKQYAPGAMVQVRFDPASPDDMVVLGLVASAAPVASPAISTTTPASDEIAATETLNQQLKTNGALCRANVLKVQETGLARDGNPFLKFELEVRPIGGAPFEARAAAVIRVASLSDYQPGHEVWVKHDPKQPGCVALYNT
jgi:hypothetical protein